MSVFEAADFDHHETVAFFDHKPSGLKAISALHSTALGVFLGLKAAVRHRLGADTTRGLTVAIQGVGKVGMKLARQLHEEGARLIVSDVQRELVDQAVAQFGAEAASGDDIVGVDCDVFSPNALGAVLDRNSIPRLQARVVAGAANNQLARDADGAELKARGILYAPDYVINGGGVICVAGQIFDWSNAEIERRVRAIPDRLVQIFNRADQDGAPTNVIADRMSEERIARAVETRHAAE